MRWAASAAPDQLADSVRTGAHVDERPLKGRPRSRPPNWSLRPLRCPCAPAPPAPSPNGLRIVTRSPRARPERRAALPRVPALARNAVDIATEVAASGTSLTELHGSDRCWRPRSSARPATSADSRLGITKREGNPGAEVRLNAAGHDIDARTLRRQEEEDPIRAGQLRVALHKLAESSTVCNRSTESFCQGRSRFRGYGPATVPGWPLAPAAGAPSCWSPNTHLGPMSSYGSTPATGSEPAMTATAGCDPEVCGCTLPCGAPRVASARPRSCCLARTVGSAQTPRASSVARR